MTGIARMRTVVVDCSEPAALAEFYRRLVGGDVTWVDEGWVVLEPESGPRLAFQRADEYAPPTWPSGERPQQFHLDVTIDDIDEAEVAVLEIGARKHDIQPGEVDGDTFRVYLDPAGHPFCLCWD
jgi:hypothetical protein